MRMLRHGLSITVNVSVPGIRIERGETFCESSRSINAISSFAHFTNDEPLFV